MRYPAVVDLFAGAGGLTASLEKAGFHTVAAVELDSDCVATLRFNQKARIPVSSGESRVLLNGTNILQKDVRRVRRADLVPMEVGPEWRPAVLAGGPPCQPFSFAGLGQGMNDPRGQLFREFVRIADELRPRFILFENVSGLVTAKCAEGRPGGVLSIVQKSFESIGYACRFALLNSADFGAPQRRVRLYMIGAEQGVLPSFPEPTHSSDSSTGLLPWVSMGECLADLPPANRNDIVRPKGRRELELRALQPGTGLKSAGIVEANRPSGHWGYRQDCFRADENLPSRTIRAATTPDWIVRDGDMRRLTWHECAVLQDFPATWRFCGSNASRFRQIGNAVQGHVGRALARVLREAVETEVGGTPVSPSWPATFHKRVRYTAAEARVNGSFRQAARDRGTLREQRRACG